MPHSLAAEFVKKWEGCRLTAYRDVAGVWTCGYGATGADVVEGATWTEAQATARLERDLGRARDAVNRLVKVNLSASEQAALMSLVFNIGEGAFEKSTLLWKLNSNDRLGAASEFIRWHHAGGKPSRGLMRRRLDEAALFLK